MKTSEFALAVSRGLSAEEKYLSSRYFYDEHGDELFRAIMATPEYYLTNAEFEILSEQSEEIAGQFQQQIETIAGGAPAAEAVLLQACRYFSQQPGRVATANEGLAAGTGGFAHHWRIS
jgi:uncharacterized SAM-dependent methyltransferase